MRVDVKCVEHSNCNLVVVYCIWISGANNESAEDSRSVISTESTADSQLNDRSFVRTDPKSRRK